MAPARPFSVADVQAFVAKFDRDIGETCDYDTLVEISIDRWLMGSPRRRDRTAA